MSIFKKSHFFILCFLVTLLFVTPLVPASVRPKFIYLIINLLIIALCAEAGLLSALPKPPLQEIKRLASLVPEITSLVPKLPEITSLVPKLPEITSRVPKLPEITSLVPKLPAITYFVPTIPAFSSLVPRVLLEKSASFNIISVVKVEEKVRKLLYTPTVSLRTDPEEAEEEEMEEEESTGQELFTKSEDFIGNFYKQLKMQRQDSWRKKNVLTKPFHDYLATN